MVCGEKGSFVERYLTERIFYAEGNGYIDFFVEVWRVNIMNISIVNGGCWGSIVGNSFVCVGFFLGNFFFRDMFKIEFLFFV